MLQAARAVCLIHLQLLQAALDVVQEPQGPRAVLPETGRSARGRGGGRAEARTPAPSLRTGSVFSPSSDGTGGTKRGDPTQGGPTPHPAHPCLLQSTYLGQRATVAALQLFLSKAHPPCGTAGEQVLPQSYQLPRGRVPVPTRGTAEVTQSLGAATTPLHSLTFSTASWS